MSIEDKYLTPSHRTRFFQFGRPQTYTDALKYSFFSPGLSILSPTVVTAETTTFLGVQGTYLKMTQPEVLWFFFHSPLIAQLVECPLSEWEVMGSDLAITPYQRCKK